jgi:xanthine dehydrogenase accessory factor
MARFLVRGSGDIGSAIALRLRVRGHAVVLHDLPKPAHARRGMAFTDALFDGSCTLEGMIAKRASDVANLERVLACGRALPVSDAPIAAVLQAVSPDVIVDARMHKHGVPDRLLDLAPLAIGLGPGFVAGDNADIVIETAWGEALGQVIRSGGARAYSGEPRSLGGHGRDRYVYAAAEGSLRTKLAIGDRVLEGDTVAYLGELPVVAPLSGILRGLTHDGARVAAGAKVLEIDPRGDPASAFGVGERPARIASGVIEATSSMPVDDPGGPDS